MRLWRQRLDHAGRGRRLSVTIRPADLAADAAGIAALDASFETRARLAVIETANGFTLNEVAIPERTKRFWVYDLDRPDRDWDEAFVAEKGGQIVGFVATSWQFWNRRVVLWHIYADRSVRGQGVGHRLIGKVYERAQRQNALAVFLETSNFNVPGIRWYKRQGFRFGGLDTTLYSGRPAAEEVGVYMVKSLAGRGDPPR